MPAGLSDLELGALTNWTRAQQAAHSYRHISELAQRDEFKAKRDEEEKKKKKKEKEKTKADQVTAADIIGNLVSTHPTLPGKTLNQSSCKATYQLCTSF